MQILQYGRKRHFFSQGNTKLVSITVTERCQDGEDEHTFMDRLLAEYGHREGILEIVFKNGKPDYAIITFDDGVGASSSA